MKHKRAKLLASLALSALLMLPFPQVAAAEEIEGAVQDEMLYVLSESYTLQYDEAAVAAVGTQKSTGHTACCLAFCEGYGDSMLFGQTVDHTEHAYYGDCASNPCADWNGWQYIAYDATYAVYEIMEGRPCIMHVQGNGTTWSSSEHWVLVIGYYDVDDPLDASINNLIVLDPWDGKIMPAIARYARHDDYELRLSSRGLSIPQTPPEPQDTEFGVHRYDQGFCIDCGCLWGDLNGTGTVTIVDAQIAYDVANGAYGSYEDNPDLWDLADASGPFGHPDGHTEAQDALAIQYYVLNN